ncbi:hypothetical protein Mapa_016318 [Marchantia paleacea]|nr:hypothetical protein Mapa_016318 [Marchantia paleacea]
MTCARHVCLHHSSSCNLDTVPVACQSSSDQEPFDKAKFHEQKCPNSCGGDEGESNAVAIYLGSREVLQLVA